MYKIDDKEFETLSDAMKHAETLNRFVVIKGADYEICGKFGVDSIENSTLPDGNEYQWKMRRDETHRSWRKKLG